MIFLIIVRYIRGYVCFKISEEHIEYFLNLCARNNVVTWGIKRKENYIFGFMLKKDFNIVYCIIKKYRISIDKICEKGVPSYISKYKRRPGIIVGCILYFAIIYVLSLFVWKIDIYGNDKLRSSDIIDSLSNIGIYIGTQKSKIHATSIEQKLILRHPQLSWVSINLHGSTADVEILERIVPPDINTDEPPANIIAKKTGQIVKMEVYDGAPVVKVGDSVLQGEMLVNGIIEDKNGRNQYKRAAAKIIARVEEYKTFAVLYNTQKTVKTGRSVTRKYIDILGAQIPLFIASEIKWDYNLIVYEEDLNILGITFPIRITKQVFEETETLDVDLSHEQAVALIEKQIYDYENSYFNDAVIIERNQQECVTGSSYIVNITYICEENIAILDEIQLDRQ